MEVGWTVNVLVFVFALSPGPVFIKHLKSNVYVTLNAIGSFQCNLGSHWLIKFFITLVSLWILVLVKHGFCMKLMFDVKCSILGVKFSTVKTFLITGHLVLYFVGRSIHEFEIPTSNTYWNLKSMNSSVHERVHCGQTTEI